MSYAEEKLDLSAIELACLTGLNGAGKSALLDAVTWALWESARASSEELIRLGQIEMWVDVCFELEGQIFRVRRSRQKSFSKSGQKLASKGNLDLLLWQNTVADFYRQETVDLAWTSLNASSMRETQERIREILKMDYDTFITSVYLRQGRADEFTTRAAGERKQVLADILGLAYFDKLQNLAKEEAKERKVRIQILEAALSSASEFEQGWQDSLADFSSLAAELQTKRQDLAIESAELSSLSLEFDQLKYLELCSESGFKRQEELCRDLKVLQEQYLDLDKQFIAKSAVLARETEIKARFNEFEKAKEQLALLDNAALAVHDLNNKRMELRSQIATCGGRLEVELEHLRLRLTAIVSRRQVLEKSAKEPDKLAEQFHDFRKLINEELEMSRKRETFSKLSVRAEDLQSLVSESRVRLDAEIQQKQAMLDELEQIMQSKGLLTSEQEELKKQSEELDCLESEFEMVEERGFKLKSQLGVCEQQIYQLRKHLKSNADKVHELRESPDLSHCPLCQSSIVDSFAVLNRYEIDNANVEKEIASLENESAQLIYERDRLRKEYLSLRQQLDSRKALDMRIGEFNEKNSAIERAESSRDELELDIEQAKLRLEKQDYAQVERESLVRIKVEINKLEFDPIIYVNLQSQIRAQRHVELRYQQQQNDLKELALVEKEIPDLENTILTISGKLEAQSYEPELRAELELIDTELKKYNYDRNLHQQTKEKLSSVLSVVEEFNELQQSLKKLPLLKENLSQLEESISIRQAELSGLESDLESWQKKLPRLSLLKDKILEQKELIAVLENESTLLLERKMALDAKLNHLKSGKSDLDAKRNLLSSTIKEMTEFTTLAEIFGKKGLQAIIIENAIPEIESETNQILSRLSDNQMHIAMLTQQRNKSGQAIETLDIVIADELGTRSYELYSGGEAFKVDFAIRVALSRLLSRRVGAKLETLIIDEGFGSQDEISRGRLIRSINSIKPDFARILVVTHIAEVKDMFSTQIAVSKEEGISKLSVWS